MDAAYGAAIDEIERLKKEIEEKDKLLTDYRFRILNLAPWIEDGGAAFPLHADGCPYREWADGRDAHEVIMDGLPGWPESPPCSCNPDRKASYWKGQFMLANSKLARAEKKEHGLSMMAALGVLGHPEARVIATTEEGVSKVVVIEIPETAIADRIDEDRPFEVRNIPQHDRKVFRLEVLLFPKEASDGEARGD